MDAKAWRKAEAFLSSLWLLDRDDDRKLDFHGAFIPAVAEGLILRHTEPGDWVWDPMAGSGTTGLVAERLARRCFMSDLTPTSPEIVQADARTVEVWESFAGAPVLLTGIGAFRKFDLIVLHPPYWCTLRFSEDEADLSNLTELDDFYAAFRHVVANARRHLKPGGYLALVCGDVWVTGEARLEPLAMCCLAIAMGMMGVGARLKAIVIKDIKGNRHNHGRARLMLSRFFRWGAVKLAHEYIFSIQAGSAR